MDEASIFLEALQRPSPEERAAFLDQACGGNRDLRHSVELLLKAHAKAGDFLAPPSTGPVEDTAEPVSTAEVPGTVIGPYKLLQQIGEGGMGTVWMAQQTEPVKRVPITKYCDEHRLTPRDRLELFLPVCQAIQHAHQKGIIHRDLKPSNVLIAVYDGKPVPKVIDFGVAKAAGPQVTDKTLVTGFGAIVGTLEYMSPEQAEINQLDIDTRSDICSLGVLLYELLTGGPPFSRTKLEKAGMLEMLRVIREQEPSRPSTKLSTAEGLPTLAANRGTEPAKLTRLVR